MNIEDIRMYCLSFPGTEEGLPFDETTLVFKVGGKIFAITGLDDPEHGINLKVETEKIEDLQNTYDYVHPGYHMNKKHWVTVKPYDQVEEALLKAWIQNSYRLIYQSLPKKKKEEING